MIVWADTEKFDQREKFLPALKIRLCRELSGESNAVAPASLPGSSAAPHQGAGVQNPDPPVPLFPTPSEPLFPPEFDGLAPSLDSEWSGLADDLGEPFSALESVVDPDPPMLPPNPSRKRPHSPDPPQQAASPATPPPPTAAVGGGMPGFMAEQVASLLALVQSCLLTEPSAPAPQMPTGHSVAAQEPASEDRSPPSPVPVLASDLPPPRESLWRLPSGTFLEEWPALDSSLVWWWVWTRTCGPVRWWWRRWHHASGWSLPSWSPTFSGGERTGPHVAQRACCHSARSDGRSPEPCWILHLLLWFSHPLCLVSRPSSAPPHGLTLPVDQDYVRVFWEGGHMAFSIAEPAEVLHAIFRPFVLAALRTHPKMLRADPPPRDGLRSLAALDLVRKRSSLSPIEASKDKWVEADKTLAAKMRDTISDARRSTSLRVNARPIPVLSSGTGFSQ